MASLIKNSLFLTLLLSCLLAQAQFTDDFSDGDFSSNPTWSGEVAKFSISDNELELSDEDKTGLAYLITSSSAAQNAVWEFYYEYNGNPSSSNRAEVYLMSDQSDLTGPLNGYYIRIGEQSSTTDKIVLYRQTGSESSEILATADGTVLNSNEKVTIRIRVTRDDIGNWEILADAEGGDTFTSLGTINDNTYNFSLFFGVKIKYSSTRSENFFFFDDFDVSGEGEVDEEKPTVLLVDVLSDTTLLVEFSEALDPTTVNDQTAYMANNGIGFPTSIELLSADEVLLTFGNSFSSGVENTLTVMSVSDLSSNVMDAADIPFTFFQTATASFNDVLITEIHAKPREVTPMPNVEFVEIYNATENAFQLENWTLQDGSISGIVELPAKILTPNTYAVICNEQFVDLFSGFGQVIGVDGLPTLNDSGDELTLRNNDGATIFNIAYSDDWYNDNIKDDGGWSLEMVDFNVPCLTSSNWTASNNSNGGTPAQANSVEGTIGDNSNIDLVDVQVVDSLNLIAIFSEKIDLGSIDNISISIDNGIGNIEDFEVVQPELNQITITLPNPIAQNNIYVLTVENIFDCAGNGLGESTFNLGLPVEVEVGDLVINEILFNPFSGNVDYIELYNKSDKLLSTADLIIAEADAIDPDSVTTFDNLNETSKLIFPNDFIVLTSNPDLVKQAYFVESPNKFVTISTSINYPDDEGVVILFRSDLAELDKLVYTEDWHHGLIDDENGVSLERISVDDPTQDENNWHSAAASVGFGTPTYLNSSTTEIVDGNEVTVTPEVISPDNDGFEDFAIINFELEQQGYVANLKIFDSKGREVNHLVKNETVALNDFYKWDGTDNNGDKVRTGLYIILLDLFDLEGNSKKYKKQIAVATK